MELALLSLPTSQVSPEWGPRIPTATPCWVLTSVRLRDRTWGRKRWVQLSSSFRGIVDSWSLMSSKWIGRGTVCLSGLAVAQCVYRTKAGVMVSMCRNDKNEQFVVKREKSFLKHAGCQPETVVKNGYDFSWNSCLPWRPSRLRWHDPDPLILLPFKNGKDQLRLELLSGCFRCISLNFALNPLQLIF